MLEHVQVPGYRVVHKGFGSEYLHLVGFEALDGHALTVEETGQLVARLAEVPGVRFTEKNLRMYALKTPNDKNYSVQWHYSAINLPAAWDVSTGASAVTVAVLDTGVVPHPDLTPRIVPGYDMISDATNAGDGDGRDSDPTDKGGDEPGGSSSWHGTHVSGTIGAATDNGSGVAGVTWTTRVMPVRVLGKQGGTSFDIAAAMNWAAGGTVTGMPNNPTPAKVLNMSLGGTASPQKTYQDVIDRARAGRRHLRHRRGQRECGRQHLHAVQPAERHLRGLDELRRQAQQLLQLRHRRGRDGGGRRDERGPQRRRVRGRRALHLIG